MSTTTAPKTFRARSLTDALAQVRDELGPDAVVVRRREGLEGGVAGFFQKAVVEIEAQPGGSALLSADAPGTSLLDDDAPIVPAPMPAPIQIAPGARPRRRGRRLRRRARDRRAHAGPADAVRATAARPCARTSTPPSTPSRSRATRHPRSCRSSPCPHRPRPSFPSRVGAPAPAMGTGPHGAARPCRGRPRRGDLRRAGLSEAFSAAVLDEATVHGLPFTDEGHTVQAAGTEYAAHRATNLTAHADRSSDSDLAAKHTRCVHHPPSLTTVFRYHRRLADVQPLQPSKSEMLPAVHPSGSWVSQTSWQTSLRDAGIPKPEFAALEKLDSHDPPASCATRLRLNRAGVCVCRWQSAESSSKTVPVGGTVHSPSAKKGVARSKFKIGGDRRLHLVFSAPANFEF